MSSESTGRPAGLERLGRKVPHLKLRHAVLAAVRQWFSTRDFTEVETPLLLDTVAPEEHIEPLKCDRGYLGTSPELEMKQLVAAGLPRVFQLTRAFRRGESGRLHAPEFTILEWYRPGTSVHDLVADLEGLFVHVADQVLGRRTLEWQGRPVDLTPPWRVTQVRDAFLAHAGWDPCADFDGARFDLDLVAKVEPQLGRRAPEVLAFYPVEQASLARRLPSDPALAQRMELYIAGLELANGFVELNDVGEQRERFEKARRHIAKAGRTPPPMPQRFLETLEFLPDCVGLALGVDRMVMLCADAARVEDVQAFTRTES